MDTIEEEVKVKKELKVRPSIARPPMIEVYYENGGELPAMLSGLYTSRKVAYRAINEYLRMRDGEK